MTRSIALLLFAAGIWTATPQDLPASSSLDELIRIRQATERAVPIRILSSAEESAKLRYQPWSGTILSSSEDMVVIAFRFTNRPAIPNLPLLPDELGQAGVWVMISETGDYSITDTEAYRITITYQLLGVEADQQHEALVRRWKVGRYTNYCVFLTQRLTDLKIRSVVVTALKPARSVSAEID